MADTTIKARSQLLVQNTGRFVICYIDLDANSNYGIFLISSDNDGITWTLPTIIMTGVAITSFKAFFDLPGRLYIYYSKIVAGVIKLYYVTSMDLGVTLSDAVEVIEVAP
jgi:hypothetical protein